MAVIWCVGTPLPPRFDFSQLVGRHFRRQWLGSLDFEIQLVSFKTSKIVDSKPVFILPK